jgi:UTP--glucose-1-phosphate uridylyltransferase
LFPATRSVKKEFFPLVGRDGIARPAILMIVEEALSAGVDEVVLVVQPEDEALFHEFFSTPLPRSHYARLAPDLQTIADRILEIGKRVQIAIQPEQEGYGHAVWCARKAVADRRFLLLLGDHVYQSKADATCAEQLCAAARLYEGSVIALGTVRKDELSSRGIAAGDWLADRQMLAIRTCAEKPAPKVARQHLRVDGLAKDSYLAFFGQYMFEPAIFDSLERSVREDQRERGEIQLTPALDALCRTSSVFGTVIDGVSYDFGQPSLYVDTLNALRE